MGAKFKQCAFDNKPYAVYHRDGKYWCNKGCYKKDKKKQQQNKEEGVKN